MICSNCSAAVRDGAKFCSECGTPQMASCPSCGSPTSPSDKFCAECGHHLQDGAADTTAASPVLPQSPPVGRIEQRRFVTVLFNDLVGFTPLAQ